MEKPVLITPAPPPQIVIGKLIKERVAAVGISKAELARRLNMSTANVHKIFKRKSLDILQLYQISIILDCDFVSIYQTSVAPHLQPNVTSYLSLGYTPADKQLYIQSLRKRIDLITDMLKALARENPHQSPDLLEAKLAVVQEMLVHARVCADAI